MKCIPQISRILFILVSMWLGLSLPIHANAQSPSVQVTVNSTRTTLESPIRLSVKLPGEDGTVDTSTIQDFSVLSRTSGSSIQIINGRVNREQTITFSLLPLREGTLEIPALRVLVDGKEAFTRPITVQVSRGGNDSEASDAIGITGEINIERPFLGQQIIYTFRLTYGVQLANTHYEPPSFEGFSATQIGDQETGQTVENGKRFQTVTISYLLMPIKTGLFTISPAMLRCDLISSRRSNRSLFDSFFDDSFFGGSQRTSKVFRTEPISIEVQPLPEWSGPEPFSGLVGQFDMRAELETDTLAVGESTTLSITLEGRGNLQDADAVACQVPEAFKQYADQPETDITLGPYGYFGKKIFRSALVPVREGNYSLKIPPMTYFNPEAESYNRLAVPPLSVTVHPSNDPAETEIVFSVGDTDGNSLSLEKKKVGFTGRDILSLKTDLDALENRDSISTVWFIALILSPGLFFLILFGILHIIKKDERPMAVMTRKARRALQVATHSIGDNDPSKLLSTLYSALLYSVLARAGIAGESLTRDEVETLLTKNNVNSPTSSEVSALFGRLESARFGKNMLSGDQQKDLLAETRGMVKRLLG